MAENVNPSLVFTISPHKKQTKAEAEEENILVLAPFTKRPKINFGDVKINNDVERSLLLINTQPNDLELNISSDELKINNYQIKIEKNKNISLKIKWQPEEAGKFNFSILIEALNSPRLKFPIAAFGTCIKPEEKKIRKPLGTIQIKASSFNSKSISTLLFNT